MSIEGIQARIIEDAKKEAEAIVDQAKEEAKVIDEANKRDAEQYFEKKLKLLEERYRKEMERTILSKRLELRKKLLDARQKWMDKAFQDAYQDLVNQDLGDYKDLMIELIGKVSLHKDEKIIFGKKGDEKLLEQIVSELNGKIKANFTLLKERRDFPWGFILRKGNVETNMSIDSLFRYKRNDLEQKAWEIFDADV
jgi:V/A-type H+-transporting ATPase subunit E